MRLVVGGDATTPAGPLRRWAPHVALLVLVLVAGIGSRPWQEQALPAPPLDRISTHTGTDHLLDPATMADPRDRRLALPAPAGRSALAGDYLAVPALPITLAPQRIGVHEVKAGETLSTIATQYGVDVPTLQWANGLTDPTAQPTVGQQLRVPPVKGMLHVVRQSDTLDSIASTYRVPVQAIIDYRPNGIRDAADVAPGRMLLAPGGTMPERTTVTMHTVQDGETVFAVAERYNVTPETIISANSLEDADFLLIGQRLAILPVSGVGLIVQAGDSVGELAARYRVDESAIRGYAPNGLGVGGEVVPGQALVVPGGRLPDPPPAEPEPAEPVVQQASAPPAQVAASAPAERPAPRPTAVPLPPAPARPAPTGRMVWPTTGSITTYFSGGHNGLDLANASGTPVVAADGGVVIWSGWRNDGLGIAVFVDHGGGLQTWYGHFSRAVVSPGQAVGRGQIIGYMGSTGRSTGPHLHFMVLQNYGYRNPLNYLP
ncbi:MAG: LysM peptidoglycan-binding domain-containing protein [Chloroflexi bacterium]|nr:LysM peptidoglycan-binding domain-containing protein [Chloroflexota bacterium]